MPRTRKRGGTLESTLFRLGHKSLCKDFLNSGYLPYSAPEISCCKKSKECKKRLKKSQRNIKSRSKKRKIIKNRKMKPGEKPGEYGSHCVNAAGRKWGHTKPKWDHEKGIAYQNLNNWQTSKEALTRPPPEFNPGKKINGLVCREDAFRGERGDSRGEWCLLDPVGGIGSMFKDNSKRSNQQMCRTRGLKNWDMDNELTLVAAKKAGYFFDPDKKAQAIDDAYEKRKRKWAKEYENSEKERKAADNKENKRKQKVIADQIQKRAHEYANEEFFDAENGEFYDAQSGQGRKSRRRRKTSGKRRRKTRRKRRRKRRR